jgi:hypothetical protein
MKLFLCRCLAIAGPLLLGGIAHVSSAMTQTLPQETQPKKRTFLGSIQVPADRRQEILQFLHNKGFKGAFIPEDASPETLLYRGTMDEHHEATMAVYKLVEDPEKSMMKKTTNLKTKPKEAPPNRFKRQDDGKTDDDCFGKMDLSPLQKELLAEFRKEMDKRSAEFRDGTPPDADKMKRGEEFNKWMHENYRAIFTRKQYNEWLTYWGGAPRKQPDGKPPFAVPAGKDRSDEAIFNKLELSPKQAEHLRKHLEWMRDASAKLKDSDDPMAEGLKLNAKWREGLDRILTKEQRQKYKDYWGSEPV